VSHTGNPVSPVADVRLAAGDNEEDKVDNPEIHDIRFAIRNWD
jgi:hypothetical protein